MLDDFLATLSHELRTPLNAMIGWTQLLRIHGTDSEIGARAVETIERNIRIQTRVIEDLLDMSSLASGKLRLDIRRRLSLRSSMRPSSVWRRSRARRDHARRRIEPDVPDVLGDPRRLEQVVWNLMSNAIQFTPAGGTVTATLQRDDAGARIDVIDTGEGIDPELLPRVFDRFRQADSSSQRHHMGLGLGLAIVKSLVEMHGGEVRAESEGEGKGATFRVLLPASPPGAGEPDETRAVPAPARTVGLPSIRGVRVLVVDDHRDSRDSFAGILEAAGAMVFVAASAKEALAAIREHHPEVMLCDVAMPGEDGYPAHAEGARARSARGSRLARRGAHCVHEQRGSGPSDRAGIPAPRVEAGRARAAGRSRGVADPKSAGVNRDYDCDCSSAVLIALVICPRS
jgi:CheY-like chemotaxis protein